MPNQPENTTPLNSLTFVGNLSIAPGIVIDAKTGNVTIPDGLSLDDASRAFWNAVQKISPSIKAAGA